MEKEYIKEYQIVFRWPRKPGLRVTKPGSMPFSHHRWPLSKPHLWIQVVQLSHHTENQRVLPEPLIFPSLRKKTYLPFSSLEWFYAAPAFCFTSCQFKISNASIWLVQLGSHTYILAAREAGNASSWLVPWEELTNGNGSWKVESRQKRKQKSILPAINNFNN